MESSRPNGTQHHVRGNKSALLLLQLNIRVAFYSPQSRHAEDERVTSFFFPFSDTVLPVRVSHDPHPACPLYRHRLNPGWRQCAKNQWEDLKEDTSAALNRKEHGPHIQQKEQWPFFLHQRPINGCFANNQSLSLS